MVASVGDLSNRSTTTAVLDLTKVAVLPTLEAIHF